MSSNPRDIQILWYGNDTKDTYEKSRSAQELAAQQARDTDKRDRGAATWLHTAGRIQHGAAYPAISKWKSSGGGGDDQVLSRLEGWDEQVNRRNAL